MNIFKINTVLLAAFLLLAPQAKADIPVINDHVIASIIASNDEIFPAESLPILHSLPSASQKVYLNFVGCPAQPWGGYPAAYTPAYDIDGDQATFSTTELANINEIWGRIAEDYAPFNLDVTTENPGSFNAKEAIEVCIGGSHSLWYGQSAGGVAFVNSWSSTDLRMHRVWVFEDNLGNGYAKFVAEAASHEAGHAFGLMHQGTYSAACALTAAYNPGSGSGETGWAPLMGVGYYQNWSVWHHGIPCFSQNDLFIVAGAWNDISYRVDDWGNTREAASGLVVLSPAGRSASGIIGHNTDVDIFSFDTEAGEVSFTVNNFEPGPNLDITARLLDSSGAQLAAASPVESLDATITATVNAGTYYLEVGPGAAYGSLGQYVIHGTVVADVAPSPTATNTPVPATATPTATPTATATATPTSTMPSTPTRTATNTPTPTLSPTATRTVVPTLAPTRTRTATPTPTPTRTPTTRPTRTPTPNEAIRSLRLRFGLSQSAAKILFDEMQTNKRLAARAAFLAGFGSEGSEAVNAWRAYWEGL